MDSPKDLVVRQSNHLIETSYKIATLGESRLLRLLIAQIQPSDEDFKTYRISVSDFAKTFGLSPTGGKTYETIDKASQGLAHRPITIRNGKSWLHTSWLSSSEYIEGAGYVELTFDKKLKPYLLQLKGYYTQYKIDTISNFRSLYSIRLYELLKMEQFKLNKDGYFKRTFEYEELREKLGIEETEYKLFADFRLYVIEMAVKEIKQNPDINITQVDYPKTGRKITHIVFHCEKAKQTQLNFSEPEPQLVEVEKEHPEDIKELISMGIDENTANKWRKKYGAKKLISNIAYARATQKAGKIKESLAGFVASAIANNLAGAWEQEEQKKAKVKKAQEKVAQEKTIIEKEEANKTRKELESMLEFFWTFPISDQIEVRRLFTDSIPDVMRKMWSRNLIEKERPEELKMHTSLFCKFLKDGGYLT